MRNPGFTLLEVALVITLVVIISAFTVPIGINFYRNQTLNEASDGILSVLRRSQNHAAFGKNDSDFGVKILSDTYVLFEGSSYVSRDTSKDASFNISMGVTATGADEIVFTKLTGVPNATGSITITAGNTTKTIEINAQGHVEYQ